MATLKPRPSNLSVITYEGAPLGMMPKYPPHELPDQACVYLQDGLLDLPGITRRRGPLQTVLGMVAFTNPIHGGTACFDPKGNIQVGILEGTTTGYFSVLSSDYSAKTQIPWQNSFTTSPYYIVDAKARVGGGSLIGTSLQYTESSPVQALAMWDGGTGLDYTTGTITTTLNSSTVTGSGTSWTGVITPGMYLFSGTTFIGTVLTVVSNTSITLVNNALAAVTGVAYKLTSLRGINPQVVTGEITCATAGATVTGSNTKFASQGMGTGTWDVFRRKDYTFVGTVSSVTNDTSLTLTANAAIAMTTDDYVAIRRDGNYSMDTTASTSKVGFLNAPYAYRQFYANLAQVIGPAKGTSRLWFSEQDLPEAIDLSPTDGDFIDVSSGTAKSAQSPIKALMPAFNSLLVLKEDESFALIGQEKEQFEVHKVYDDGTLSGMSVQQYGDSVYYAGRNGIYRWDGTSVTNVTDGNLGLEYKAAVKNFNPTTSRMWSAIARDHYLVFIESVTPRIGLTQGTVTSIPTRWTISLNLLTGSVSLWTNVDIRGTLQLPAVTGQGPWLFVNTSNGGAVCDGNAIFDTTGNDQFTCTGNVAGPFFYIESKRYPLGDPLRRKQIKQVAMYYQSGSDGLTIDTLVGLGLVVGSTNTTAFPISSQSWDTLGAAFPSWDSLAAAYPSWDGITAVVWFKKRYKFLKHDNFIGFRIYQDSYNNSDVRLGPWQIGFNVQAAGRI